MNWTRGIAFAALLFVAGCATGRQQAAEPTRPYRHTPEGTVVWQEAFEFTPPPNEWKLVQVEEGDNEFSFAFLKKESCPFPCQSTFAYDEEPFGYSRDLRERQREFFRRFLWASRVRFDPADVEVEPVRVLGGEGLRATATAADPVTGHKVWAEVVLGKRGERVVSFYLTQWRPAGTPFDRSVAEPFHGFIESFRFLRESFYQGLSR